MNVEVTFSAIDFLEITPIGQNKGNGILDYCKLKNVDIKDMIYEIRGKWFRTSLLQSQKIQL